jgi:hypothetical protein
MMSFIEWMHEQKKKERKNEPRRNQISREGGYVYNEREVVRDNSQVSQQTVHVFAVPEL